VTVPRAVLAAALLAIALAVVGGEAAAADARMRVLIVVDASDDPFAERIKAEVSSLGLEVVAVEPWRTGETVESLDAAGRANQAAAAIRMIPSRKGVEVWMANQPTGRSLLRQLIVDERAGAPNEGLVALQTAELLRTTLLSQSEALSPSVRVSAARNAPDQNQPPPPPPAPPSPPSAGLQAAVGALYSPGNNEPAIQAWLTINRVVFRPFGLALDLSAPLRASTVTGPEGSATVGALLAGVTVFAHYERANSGLYGTAAAGVAGIRITAEGTVSDPLVAHKQSALAGAVYVRGDGGFEVARWLRFGVRAIAGAVPSGVSVRFAGNEAAVWGRPFLAGMLLADLAW
jgi:hypothetical protein